MTDASDIHYKNNPLHGVGLKQMLEELVSHYGFQILFAYLNINCFKTNPTVDASVKFLKKTDWAREKVEQFYLYRYKNLPNPSSEQFKLSPRDRIIPDHHQPREPQVLTLEDAAAEQEKRERKAAAHNQRPGARRGGQSRAGNNRAADGWPGKRPAERRVDSTSRDERESRGSGERRGYDDRRGSGEHRGYDNRRDSGERRPAPSPYGNTPRPAGQKVDPWASARQSTPSADTTSDNHDD